MSRMQIAQIGRPSYFETVLELDHLAEIPIVSRFQEAQRDTRLLIHREEKLSVATPKV
jgi:hypothetical protein